MAYFQSHDVAMRRCIGVVAWSDAFLFAKLPLTVETYQQQHKRCIPPSMVNWRLQWQHCNHAGLVQLCTGYAVRSTGSTGQYVSLPAGNRACSLCIVQREAFSCCSIEFCYFWLLWLDCGMCELVGFACNVQTQLSATSHSCCMLPHYLGCVAVGMHAKASLHSTSQSLFSICIFKCVAQHMVDVRP